MDAEDPLDKTLRLLGPEGYAFHLVWLEKEITSNRAEVPAELAADLPVVFKWAKDFLAGKATTKDGKFADPERIAMLSKNPRMEDSHRSP